ncbi:MAG: hypothetical protein EOM15_11260 [Spirochaetia bacterium]|nr:hypothetical protein [Spirochaetia bacterium]
MPQIVQSPMFIQPVIKQFFDLLNLDSIRVPSVEELQQEQAMIQHHKEQIEQQEREQKAMEERFASLPLTFDSDVFLQMLLEDTQRFHSEKEVQQYAP